MSGGFEERVRSGLATAATEYEPSPGLRREVDRRIHRHRRGRIAAGVVGAVGAVVFIAGLGVLLATDDEGNQNESIAATTVPASWREIEALGLAMDVPAGWHVQPFGPQCRVAYRGLLASNLDADREFVDAGADGCTTEWAAPEAMSGEVVVELSRLDGGPGGPAVGQADTQFPLIAEWVAPSSVGAEVATAMPIVIGGEEMAWLSLWVGPEASEADVANARRIIGSIRPAGAEAEE